MGQWNRFLWRLWFTNYQVISWLIRGTYKCSLFLVVSYKQLLILAQFLKWNLNRFSIVENNVCVPSTSETFNSNYRCTSILWWLSEVSKMKKFYSKNKLENLRWKAIAKFKLLEILTTFLHLRSFLPFFFFEPWC